MAPSNVLAQDSAAVSWELQSEADYPAAPSEVELAFLVTVTFIIFGAITVYFRPYTAAIDAFGDSSAYMSVASALRRWDFHGIVIKQFWGLPYAMAALSKVTGLSDRTSLLVFSLVSSLAAVLLTRRLWDGWIAGYFAILNFDWLQRSCLGGSEPLFMFALLASFFCVRRERWVLASALAGFATVVRPLGIFALLGIGLTLLWKRQSKHFLAATAAGLTIGTLYAIPLATHFGDAMANVNSYHSKEWAGGWLFGFPFYAIVKGTLFYPAPWTNLILSFGWIFLVVVATILMVRSASFHAYCKTHLVEAIFLVPYLWCLLTYNYPSWARSNFARFSIPILPFVFLALHQWIPKDRRLLWGVGALSSVLAACSAIGIVNVIHAIRNAVH